MITGVHSHFCSYPNPCLINGSQGWGCSGLLIWLDSYSCKICRHPKGSISIRHTRLPPGWKTVVILRAEAWTSPLWLRRYNTSVLQRMARKTIRSAFARMISTFFSWHYDWCQGITAGHWSPGRRFSWPAPEQAACTPNTGADSSRVRGCSEELVMENSEHV